MTSPQTYIDRSPDKYFRIGHMGITVVDTDRGDVDKIITSLKEAVEEAKEAAKL